MKAEEYAEYEGLGLADLVRRGEVRRTELMETAIDIAERRNEQLNAICHKKYEHGLETAKTRDGDKRSAGAFDGVPYLLKDLAGEIEGWPQERGCRALKGNLSTVTTTLTKRQLAAGLIPFARTTTPEFGLIGVTESDLYGDTRNPWSLAHTPGGSSGGSAAAVAAGVTPIAHANDGGGSIRIPASCAGLVGMKPSRGRNPVGPGISELAFGIAAEHVVTRTVRDSAALLDLTQGPEEGEPYSAPAPEGSFLEAMDAPHRPMRIGFSTNYWADDRPTHPECVAAVRNTCALLGELGHQVEEKRPAVDYAAVNESFFAIWSALADGTVAFLKSQGATDEMFETMTLKMAEKGRSISSGQLVLAREHVMAQGRIAAAFHQDYDVLVTSVLGAPPLKVGEWPRDASFIDNTAAQKANDMVLVTPLQNATGQPSLSLPLHMSEEGLPVGVMFTAAYGREDVLFQLAGQLERAAPWIHRKPPNWA